MTLFCNLFMERPSYIQYDIKLVMHDVSLFHRLLVRSVTLDFEKNGSENPADVDSTTVYMI